MAKKNTPKKKMQKKTQSKIDNLKMQRSFAFQIDYFVKHIESIKKSLDISIKSVSDILHDNVKYIDKFLEEKVKKGTDKDGKEFVSIKPEHVSNFEHLQKKFISSSIAIKTIPRIFFCSLIHQYDAYLGNLLKAAYYSKPELLHSSDKQLSFADLSKYKNLDEAREYLIEKEIEDVIRKSHIKHFEWMERMFNIPLRKDLDIWSTFVEITERRNLFVHCDGKISSQYLNVCNENGIVFKENYKIGEELHVDKQYFDNAFQCIYEIGIKLGIVLWKKLIPDELEGSDRLLHLISYELLSEERYNLAIILLKFATKILKKHSSDNIRRMNIINLAIAYKFSKQKKLAINLLKEEDWSACSKNFKLAVAILEDRNADAITIMKEIHKSKVVTKRDYSTWPLFKEFRKNKLFIKTYKELYGEEFTLPEEPEYLNKSMAEDINC